MRIPTKVIPVVAIVALCAATSWAAAEPQREQGNRGRGDAAAAKSTPREHSSDQRVSRDTRTNSSPSRRNETAAASPRDTGSRVNSRSAGEASGNAPSRNVRDTASYRGSNSKDGSYPGRDSYGNRGGNGGRDAYSYGESNGHGGSYGHGSSYGYRDSHYYRGTYSPRAYYRPMPRYGYIWRPYLNLGFGLWSGYPLAFPYESYYYSRSVTYASYGGLSFEVAPGDAYIFVDGNYVGAARDFGPFTQPLTLMVGMHRIAIDAPGYRGVEFGVEVLPGQLIPYRGELEYLGPR